MAIDPKLLPGIPLLLESKESRRIEKVVTSEEEADTVDRIEEGGLFFPLFSHQLFLLVG